MGKLITLTTTLRRRPAEEIEGDEYRLEAFWIQDRRGVWRCDLEVNRQEYGVGMTAEELWSALALRSFGRKRATLRRAWRALMPWREMMLGAVRTEPVGSSL